MRIARIFDLLDADRRSLQMEIELEEANALWGTPTEDVLAMMVWLKMLAERGHYTSLIEGARRLFTQELEDVETIENAYRALLPAFILEPLHSHELKKCEAVRQQLVRAIKALNTEYLESQSEISKKTEDSIRLDEAAVERPKNQFQQMHIAILSFYREMDGLAGKSQQSEKLLNPAPSRLHLY